MELRKECAGLAVKEDRRSRDPTRGRMPFLISSGKINSVPRRLPVHGHTCVSVVRVYARPAHFAWRDKCSRRKKQGSGFDSWPARSGIFLIHRRRVTYCDVENN